MPIPSLWSRRAALGGLIGAGSLLAARPALAAGALDATDLGLVPDARDDQSATLQAAIDEAQRAGRPLFLPGGVYFVSDVRFPQQGEVRGMPGGTILAASGDGRVAYADGSWALTIEGLKFDRGNGGPVGEGALFEASGCESIAFSRCAFLGSGANGLALEGCGATVEDCDFRGHNLAAIFALDGRFSRFSGNTVTQCNNNGVLVWGSEAGRRDGTIVAGNHFDEIGFDVEGNGQNGNAINVYRADGVIVANNHIARSLFTAIRLNGTNDTQVIGNTCLDSGEVAIFSEFAFSGSVIANNLVDGAATGISMTNLDHGGRLAVCSGNIVRNIAERSLVNPDTRPIGIHAEAETTVTGNVVDNVPGIGIMAGYGTFLRNVVIADNVINAAHVGIGVSVVEDPSPGPVTISNNLIFEPLDHGIVGLLWDEIASDDLARDAARYPHVSISGNMVARL